MTILNETNLTDGTLTRDERVARTADLFIEKFAVRISPIAALEGALFGYGTPVGNVKIVVLEGAVQAANELWSTDRPVAARLANQAIDQALRLIRSDISTDDGALQAIIARALPLITR